MGIHPKVVFTNSEVVEIYGYSITENLVSLRYSKPVENTSGFSVYMGDGLVFDGSNFTYRWDVVDQKENEIYYTNDPDYRQMEPWPDMSNVPEQAEPLTNEELTEAVADLMYEVSAAKLGL